MMELDTITIKGFKSIKCIDALHLGPINVVIGSNGSGKSNFIGVFAFLHAIREGHLREYVKKAGGADKILHFGAKVTGTLEIRVSFEEGVNQYRITLEPTEWDELAPVGERVYGSDLAGPGDSEEILSAGLEAAISRSPTSEIVTRVQEHLDRWRIYHFHDTGSSSPMKKMASVNDNRYLRPDASNLAAFLYFLRKKHESSYSMIRRTVQRVAPFFDDFMLEPENLNPDIIRLEWRHKGSDAYFNASTLSDGTLRFMALATLFLQPEEFRPSVIIVDEPELGLHPYAITLLASMVKEASFKTQVILSTQSATLLDHFEPEDVLVAERVDGGTVLKRLESDRLAEWLKDYSLGQLWEQNELGGRPTVE